MLQYRMMFSLVLLSIAAATEGSAAVRTCQPAVSSILSNASTEQLAKKGALDSWIAKAKTYGAGYTSWRLAVNKTLKCVRSPTAGYDCIALAAPCTIQQAPGRPKKAPPSKPITI